MAESPTDSDDTAQHDPDLTVRDSVRWKYLASLITSIVLIGFMALITAAAAGVMSLGAINQAWFVLFSTVVMMAAVWLWGADTLAAVREARQE